MSFIIIIISLFSQAGREIFATCQFVERVAILFKVIAEDQASVDVNLAFTVNCATSALLYLVASMAGILIFCDFITVLKVTTFATLEVNFLPF